MDRFPSLRPLPWLSRCLAALLLGVALSLAAFGVGCGDYCLFCDEDGNASPQAIASADKTAPMACEKDTVSLDGRGSSDPDGDSLTYQWGFTERPAGSSATIQSATASQASFQPDEAGSYTIELTVEDPGGRSDTSSVTVTASSAPVADAGADQQVSLGQTVTLDGGDSANPEEGCTTDGLAFSWSLADPEGGESDLGTDVEETFTAAMEGTYTATLSVETGSGSDSDEVQITVGGATLESLEYGLYSFTVEQVDDTVFFGLVGSLLPPGTPLGGTVDIPSPEEVPVTRTISLSPVGGSFGEAVVEVDRENPDDNFYTLTGTASGTASYMGVQCQIEADCTGQMTPETTTTVGVSITLSNPVVTGHLFCQGANTQGTIEMTINGTYQSAQ